MFQPLDGPAAHDTISVGTGAVVEAKIGASSLEERKVLTIQPTDKLYIYWGDGSGIPSVGTVSADGITLFKNGVYTFEASRSQPIYMLSVSGTIDVKVVERS